MKCWVCGKEMKNTIGGCYSCDCGFGLNDAVNRSYLGSCWGSGGTNNIDRNNWSYQPTIIKPDGTQSIIDGPIIGWSKQGWICPKCGAVLSPSMSFCPFCSPTQEVKITRGTRTMDFDLNLYTKTISEDK